MPPPLFIALRFIGHRKKAVLLSLTGVILGVAFYIGAQAQTQGFEQFFVRSVLDSSGAILIEDRFQARFTDFLRRGSDALVSVTSEKPRRFYEGVSNPSQIMKVVRDFSSVAAAAPVLEGSACVCTDLRTELFRVIGIDLNLHLKATALAEQIVEGSMEDFRSNPSGLILGKKLARKVGAHVGQNVTVLGTDGESRTFRVCAFFQSGILIIDEKRGLVHTRAAQGLLKKPSGVSQILVKLRDPSRAPEVAAHFERVLQHRSRSWQEREQGNLQLFRIIRISAAITVSTVILLAGFGIFNVLTLMVLDKVREIAVLRSMGYRRADISAIFLWQGFLVAVIGSVLGCAAGALLTYGISQIPADIGGVLTTKRFLVHWSAVHYWEATVIAFVAVFVASFFPSRRAAKLAPVTVLRGSGP